MKRSMGVWPVSACWRVLHTCSAQARKRSLSSLKLAMPCASASAEEPFADEPIEPLLLAAALG